MARGTMSVEDGVRAMIPFIYDPQLRGSGSKKIWKSGGGTFPTAAGYFAQVQGISLTNRLAGFLKLKVPTLVVHGESDRLVPPENGRRLARLIERRETGNDPQRKPHFPY